MKLNAIWSVALASLLALGGCGGASGGGSLSASGSSNVGFFLTDNLNTGYDHVWVTVKAIDVYGNDGPVRIFDEPAGQTVDLLTLRDSSGNRFRFVSNGDVPKGPIASISITVDKTATLFTTGATIGNDVVFEGSGDADKVLSLGFPTPIRLVSGDKFVVDFDLAAWQENAGVLSAPSGYLRVGSKTGIDDSTRHEAHTETGTVRDLGGTAPTQTFKFAFGKAVVPVTTDENTTVTNENGDPNPVLGNDEKVRVKGVFDGVKQAVLASEITILNGTGSGNGGGGNSGGGNSGGGSEQERSYRASGPGSNFSADAGTFDLTIKDADGFKPEKLKVGIVTTADTVFSGDSGVKLTKEEFFAKATEGAGVGVQGNFGPGVTSVTATQVRLLNDPDNKNHAPREFSLRGPLSHIERSAQTFALKVKEFEGVPFAPNTDIWIIVDENTKYGTADAPLTATEFFAGAELNKGYEMRGVLDATTRRLKALWVRPAARLDQK